MKFLKLFPCLFFPTFLWSQDTLTVKEAVKTGLKNNFSIRISKEQLAINKNNVSQGNAGMLPEIRVSARQNSEVTNTNLEFVTEGGINRKGAKSNTINGGIQLSWTLFDGLNMFTTYEKLKEIRQIGTWQFHQKVLENIYRILNTYHEVILKKQQHDLVKHSLSLERKRKNIARAQYELGSGSKLAYLQARVEYNADTSRLLTLREAIGKAKTNLNELTGRAVDRKFEVEPSYDIDQNLILEELRQKLLNRNPSLRISEKEKKLSILEMNQSRSKRYPTLDLIGGYDFLQSRSEAGFVTLNRNSGINYGISLNYDLFNGFNIQREIRNAQQYIKISNLKLQQKKNQLEAQLTNLYREYKNNLMLMNLEEENLSIARENYEVALESYKLGNISYLDLKTAQDNYLESGQRLLTAKYNAKKAELELRKLSGILVKKKAPSVQ